MTIYFYLLLGAAIFLLQQKRRRWFPIRFAVLAAVGVLIMNHLYYYFLVTFKNMTNLGNLAIFASALLWVWVIARCCFEISWSEACFCAVAGYGAQFIHSTPTELAGRLMGLSEAQSYLFGLGIAVIIYGFLYLFFGRKLKKGQNFNVDKWYLMLLVAGAVVVEIVLCYNLRQQWILALDEFHMVCDCALLTICSFAILTAQLSLLVQQDLANELKIINQMRRKDQEQYRISSETIDLINRKCHDMRHQIRSIGQSANVDPAVLTGIERSIGIYDAIYDTGCQALDIILTEKSLYCQNNNIIISCIVDAAGLDFISDADIYSLFGNILDNAIHAVQNLAEEKRVVGLTVRRQGELLSINSHNYYSGQIVMRDGLPVTSTGDPDNHGFGVKSIAATVTKYGGTFSFRAKDGVFDLNILFPSRPSLAAEPSKSGSASRRK